MNFKVIGKWLKKGLYYFLLGVGGLYLFAIIVAMSPLILLAVVVERVTDEKGHAVWP